MAGNVTIIPGGMNDLGFVKISDLSSAVGLGTIPDNTKVVTISCEGQSVRYRADGTSPAAAVGNLLPTGQTLQYSAFGMDALEFIETAGSAILNVNFYG